MKILKIKYQNHPILGNLELDFIDPQTGEPFDTILLAGENGTGKTSILDSISLFLNGGTFEFFEYILYSSNNREMKAIPTTSNNNEYYVMEDVGAGTRKDMNTSKNVKNSNIDEDPQNIRFSGCVISKARADYKTKEIRSTTTRQLDKDKYDLDTDDDFTSLKQLIVDIENQDNSEYAALNKRLAANPKSWEEFYTDSKIYRFKSAFDNFFDKLEYYQVQDIGSEKSIIFKKGNNSITIDQLSTGEKQIVFRGTYLLKNTEILDGSAIMIDEPELSMHPKWQNKILNYYTDLFTKDGDQKAQIFFASHSDHVLKNALSDSNSNLVIVLNDNSGNIVSKKINAPLVLPSITYAETNYLAFDIASNDYHIELYGEIQNKYNLTSVKRCDDYIKAHQEYNPVIHRKLSASPQGTNYETSSTFIRNAIHHPSPTNTFDEEDLRKSIELLIKII